MQCACAILPSVACSALQYYPTLSHKRLDCGKKKVTERNVSSDFLYNICSEIFPILRTIERDVIMNVHRSLCKVQVIIVRL
jgi:hypothetical protein